MARRVKVLGLLVSGVLALGCGEDTADSVGGASTGSSDGGSGDGGGSQEAGADGGHGPTTGAGTTGSGDGGSTSTGDGGATGDSGTGSTSDASADSSASDASEEAGMDGAMEDAGEEAAAPECSGGERRCDGQQPQQCSGEAWQDDGEACAYWEPCDTASGTCQVASIEVPGGTIYRSYDAEPMYYTDMTHPATVATLRIDTYEVTVGQFRRFVSDWLDGWTPDAGAGKHTHIHSGTGLANAGLSSAYEGGWQTAWDSELPTTSEGWDDALDCSPNPSFQNTWTSTAGANEDKPISCVNWYDAYAYCIWSGGFLPTEAERNHVAAGGDEQRRHPWGNTAPSSTLVVYNTTSPADVGSKPAGNGRWGHADLSGNVSEWTLDYFVEPYVTPCNNCAQLDPGSPVNRVVRGGDFYTSGWGLLSTGNRSYIDPAQRAIGVGVRCARAPGG